MFIFTHLELSSKLSSLGTKETGSRACAQCILGKSSFLSLRNGVLHITHTCWRKYLWFHYVMAICRSQILSGLISLSLHLMSANKTTEYEDCSTAQGITRSVSPHHKMLGGEVLYVFMIASIILSNEKHMVQCTVVLYLCKIKRNKSRQTVKWSSVIKSIVNSTL